MVSELTCKGLAFLWLACSQTLASFSGLDCKQAKTGARESLGTRLLRPQEMLLHHCAGITFNFYTGLPHMHIYVVSVLKQAFQHMTLTLGLRLQTSNSPAMVSIRPETPGLSPPLPTVLASGTANRCDDKQ